MDFNQKPLADLIRPSELSEVVGQEHILGKNGVLTRLLSNRKIPNMIFFGPSGVGKTTVANIIAKTTNKKLYKLNGTNASVADIKAITDSIDTIMTQNGILLYLDEIQYFNKKQQQSLLEFIENGKITLIASTTENPYFYIYPAILSRSTVFEFKSVSPSEIKKAVKRAFDIMGEENNVIYKIDDDALAYIASACGGDVRKSINTVELLSSLDEISEEQTDKKREIVINFDDVKTVAQKSAMKYDRSGDIHYNLLSAFQKSIRGSDPDAAVHYLARLVEADDLISICRRLLVIASEDIGLAFPQAASIVKALTDSALQLGFPEARIPLCEAVILLATAPKSNSAICAIDAALADVQSGNYSEPPDFLKDTHYGGAQKLGYGKEYVYPHEKPYHYYPVSYMPEVLKNTVYYKRGDNKYEKQNEEYWNKIKDFYKNK